MALEAAFLAPSQAACVEVVTTVLVLSHTSPKSRLWVSLLEFMVWMRRRRATVIKNFMICIIGIQIDTVV